MLVTVAHSVTSTKNPADTQVRISLSSKLIFLCFRIKLNLSPGSQVLSSVADIFTPESKREVDVEQVK
jgi:hypothetical protein